MPAEVHPTSETEAPPANETESPPPVSLEKLLNHCRDLATETAGQFRDVVDLAFMELELAVNTSRWWLLAMFMFCTSSVLAFAFIVSAAVLLFVDSESPATVLLICAAVNAVVACMLLLAIKSLSKKMVFRNLRQQLTRAKPGSDVET